MLTGAAPTKAFTDSRQVTHVTPRAVREILLTLRI